MYLWIEIMVDTQKNKQVNGCEQLGERFFFTSLILTLIFYYFVSIPLCCREKEGGGVAGRAGGWVDGLVNFGSNMYYLKLIPYNTSQIDRSFSFH